MQQLHYVHNLKQEVQYKSNASSVMQFPTVNQKKWNITIYIQHDKSQVI